MAGKLRFVARGDALVQNFERLEQGTKCFVGRKWIEIRTSDPTAAALAAIGAMDLDGPSRWGWVGTNEPEEVAYRAEYVKACKDGDLWPADAATAAACGVPFDPKFGEASPPKSALVRPTAADKES